MALLEFIAANFAVLMLLCIAGMVLGLVMWLVGNAMNRKYTKIMHQHEWGMDPDDWEAWSREQGYRRTQR